MTRRRGRVTKVKIDTWRESGAGLLEAGWYASAEDAGVGRHGPYDTEAAAIAAVAAQVNQ